MNPNSGRGEPAVDDVVAEAARWGVEARVLGPTEKAGALARAAADAGVPVLGAAGGDGTLAPVAAVAVEADVPFVPVPFGTRNHFARDVGLDHADPLGALAAFAGEELRVDVGVVEGRVFLNNVSLGLYASLVHDPEHGTKNRLVALLRMIPAAFGRSRRALHVSFEAGDRQADHDALVLVVANNDYDVATPAELDARSRLDEGRLHAYVIEATSRRALVGLLARAVSARVGAAEGWAEYAATQFRVESRRRRIHAAVDGEPVVFGSRLEFEIQPRALRVLLPRGSGIAGETAA